MANLPRSGNEFAVSDGQQGKATDEESAFAPLRVQMVTFDYYMSRPMQGMKYPTNMFKDERDVSLPVIRICGPTFRRQKACVHVHGVFPYMYVEYREDWPADKTGATRKLKQFALALEAAMNFACRISDDGSLALDENGRKLTMETVIAGLQSDTGRKKRRHIASLSLVRATPFYGYHSEESLFIKIVYFNPSEGSRLAALLRGGSILNAAYMPYEAHLPFLLQFAINHNLHGMDFLYVGRFHKRNLTLTESGAKDPASIDDTKEHCPWKSVSTLKERTCYSPCPTARQTNCDIEVDAMSQDIENAVFARRRLSTCGEMVDGLDDNEPILPSLGPLWDDEVHRCVAAGLDAPIRRTKLWEDFTGRNPEPLDPSTEERVRESLLQAISPASTLPSKSQKFAELYALSPSLNSLDEGFAKNVGVSIDLLDDMNDFSGLEELLDKPTLLSQLSQEGQSCVTPTCRYSTDDKELAELLEWVRQESKEFANPTQAALEVDIKNEALGREKACYDDSSCGSDDEEDYWKASQVEVQDILTCVSPTELQNEKRFTQRVDGGNADDDQSLQQPIEMDIENAVQPFESQKRIRLQLESYTPSSQGDLRVSSDSSRLQAPSAESLSIAILNGRSTKDLFQNLDNVSNSKFLDSTCCAALRVKHVGPPRLTRELQKAFRDPPLLLPFYGDPRDAPARPGVVGGKMYPVRTSCLTEVQPFGGQKENALDKWRSTLVVPLALEGEGWDIYPLALARRPPRVIDAIKWLNKRARKEAAASPPAQETAQFYHRGMPSSPKYDELYGPLQSLHSAPHDNWKGHGSEEHEELQSSNPLGNIDPVSLLCSKPSSAIHLPYGKGAQSQQQASTDKNSVPLQQTGAFSSCDCSSRQDTGYLALAGSISLLTIASVEIFAGSGKGKLPDPTCDAIHCVAVSVYEPGLSCMDPCTIGPEANMTIQLFIFDLAPVRFQKIVSRGGFAEDNCSEVRSFPREEDLFEALVETMRKINPDVMIGFDLERDSIGYLHERASCLKLDGSLLHNISRVANSEHDRGRSGNVSMMDQSSFGGGLGGGGGPQEAFGSVPSSSTWCPGRVTLNLWRVFRSSFSSLRSFSLHACAKLLLGIRVPTFEPGPWPERLDACVDLIGNVLFRSKLNLSLLASSGSLQRAAELARVLGLDMASVYTRGSQRRVEAVSGRLLLAAGYLPPSPSAGQVAGQPAMEQLPLVMEPEAGVYDDPVAVLDFESLYPSLMIAYNMCFSTALGQEAEWKRSEKARSFSWQVGFSEIPLPVNLSLMDAHPVVVSPSRAAFVPHALRIGVLPRMLSEILATRRMVKAAATKASFSARSTDTNSIFTQLHSSLTSQTKADMRALAARLDGQQLALKLLANVTYGYAAAGFSGHMPMAELADAIVSFGRAAASAAKRRIESNRNWNARVVYGDTDSLFVHFPGRTLQEAFELAESIAQEVTQSHLPPIRLKVDKVFFPCALIAKKRYVGMAATSSHEKPRFDAKGIETVRRDTCPFAAASLERCLHVFFTTKDLSKVRKCAQRAFGRAINCTGCAEDFLLAREVRAGMQYRGTRPPAAVVAAKRAARDPRDRTLKGERVEYIVVAGAPGARLVDMVAPPEDFYQQLKDTEVALGNEYSLSSDEEDMERQERLNDGQPRWSSPLRLHGMYYASKQLAPALDRVFRLVGADVYVWLHDTPRRPSRLGKRFGTGGALPRLFARAARKPSQHSSNGKMRLDERTSHAASILRARDAAARRWRAKRACASCIASAQGSAVDVRAPPACRSFACPILHARYDFDE